MSSAGPGKRTLETTRGRILALLRRGPRTVDELAQIVGTTDNAVRSHLVALERDGLVRRSGVRRGPGAGKPALVYELPPEAEPQFSKAYPPVLAAVLEVLLEELPEERSRELLRQAGRKLASQAGGKAKGPLRERVRAAAALLTTLGGEVEVAEEGAGLTIRGYGCPLSAAVSKRPEVCGAVGAMVSEVTGARVRECCEHGERPRCGFRVGPAA